MADISKEIKAFREAMYGEEIRGSMISLANKVNDEVKNGTEAIWVYAEAENGRVMAEESRQENEAMRSAAENDRAEEFQRLRQEVEEATLSARGAATNAVEATAEAVKAVDAATEAVRAASAATESAVEATEEAAEATRKADGIAESLEGKLENGELTGTVEVGTVTTGAPGTKASVENVGTLKEAVLDFVIPQGLTGRVENIDTVAVEFQQAPARENIESGETFKGIFGKIKKWLSDLKSVAFTASYTDLLDAPEGTNNLLATEPGTWLDAVQGKMLSDTIDKIRDDLLLENIERNNYKDNLLQVSLQIKKHDSNKTRLVYNPSQNCPISSTPVLGLWKCFWFNTTHVFVEFTEYYPMQGRVWTNFYNTDKWSGWSSQVPQTAVVLHDDGTIRYIEGGTTKLRRSIEGFTYLRITYYVVTNGSVDPKTTYFTSIIPVYSPAIARTMLVGTQYIYTLYFGIDIIGDTLYSRSGKRVKISGEVDDYNNQLYILKIEGLR